MVCGAFDPRDRRRCARKIHHTDGDRTGDHGSIQVVIIGFLMWIAMSYGIGCWVVSARRGRMARNDEMTQLRSDLADMEYKLSVSLESLKNSESSAILSANSSALNAHRFEQQVKDLERKLRSMQMERTYIR